MTMQSDGRAGKGPAVVKVWPARAAVLAVALALTACTGGGGSPPGGDPQPPVTEPGPVEPEPTEPEPTEPEPTEPEPTEPEPTEPDAGSSAVQVVSWLHFDYTLERDGARPIEADGFVPLSCPAEGCAASDLRMLSGTDGADTRDGFGTITGLTAGQPLTEALSGASASVSGASFTRYGFWGEHGYAAVEVGAGMLSAERGGEQWSGRFMTAHAWAGGETSGTNPVGTGSAVWRGIAEATRTADFTHLPGTAELRIADLSRPRIDVDIDLDDGGDDVALRWTGVAPAAGAFAKGTAGTDRIDGRFHGPGHEEAWGVFDTGMYVGAFGAKAR